MTSYIYKRCLHCQDMYDFQSSGHGCFNPLNDSNFCEECKNTILAALENVPLKFEIFWDETNEIDIQTLVDIHEEQEQKIKEENRNRIFGQRIGLPVWDVNDLSNSCIPFYITHNNREYLVYKWDKTPEKNQVYVQKEKSLITGEVMYYRKDIT